MPSIKLTNCGSDFRYICPDYYTMYTPYMPSVTADFITLLTIPYSGSTLPISVPSTTEVPVYYCSSCAGFNVHIGYAKCPIPHSSVAPRVVLWRPEWHPNRLIVGSKDGQLTELVTAWGASIGRMFCTPLTASMPSVKARALATTNIVPTTLVVHEPALSEATTLSTSTIPTAAPRPTILTVPASALKGTYTWLLNSSTKIDGAYVCQK
jgi:hypothetical protein